MIKKEFGKTDDSLIVVSAVIPCYNVASKMSRCLEAFRNQTYKNIELIFVNDGSTDNTEEMIFQYIPMYVDLGMHVKYIYQENKGVGGAINTGLKEVTGKYLIWPDPDDWIADNSIERKMGLLEENPEYGMITSNAYLYNADDLEHPIGKQIKTDDETVWNPNQFEALIRYNSTFCSGCHMIRVSMMRDVNPHMDIFEGKRGQNFQMLMPMYYKYPRMLLDECLYHYVIYADSMSRGDDTLEKCIIRADGLLEIINETLDRMNMSGQERDKYKSIVQIDDLVDRYLLGIRFGNREYSLKLYEDLRSRNHTTDIPLLKRIIVHNQILFDVYPLLKKFRGSIRGMIKG